MPSPTVAGSISPMDLQPGEHLIDGTSLQVAIQDQQSHYSLTALAGGGASGATQLYPGIDEISVSVTTADSALLPYASAGLQVNVINNGAQTANVWPQQANPNNEASAADIIVPTGGGTTTSSAVTANTIASFYCYKPGYWKASV